MMVLVRGGGEKPVNYYQVSRYFQQEKVEKFYIKDNNVLILSVKGEPDPIKYSLFSVDYFREDLGDLIADQVARGVITDYDYELAFEPPWWVGFIPYLFMIVIFVVLWYFMFNRGAGGADRTMKFGKARTRLGSDESKRVSFGDVAGADEEKAELAEIVDFLKAPKKFIEIGARIPKGILLVGPPGTGKTLLAKAVSGEAGCQFLSISGSDFVELYVGVGASRVRDLFEQAKKLSPCIVFIDEIDAVGRHRGAGLGGGHDEREQTLNQLLVEMDGFGNNEGIIVLAATNRRDILDPALLRPGRFDREVYVGIPDIKGREAILKVHSRNKVLDAEVNLTNIAKTTAGFTGADLENLLNESALLAARKNHRAIKDEDLSDALLKVIAGPEKRSKVITDKDRKLTAYHEAGHAVVSRSLETQDPVHHITIIPRGMAGGMNIRLPKEDKSYMAKSEMYETIVVCLGGRVAEKLVLDEISTGASDDIRRSTQMARSMVTRYGMSDNIGPINFDADSNEVFIGRDYGHTRSYSEQTASLIDSEIKGIIDQAYKRCQEILQTHMEKLHKVADYLLEHETMDGPVFERFFSGDELLLPEV
ncbi:MAG: ATP-dependent zinc metalloprotease FtsH [Oscillospiraceae bacterium]|nr:ATP-dependent zinc metalloprotease FtsH [Oscillospiraceae bacterium]